MVSRLDFSGDGYIDVDEFFAQFDASEAAHLKRMAPSLDGLPCLAVYRGGARVITFPDGVAKTWNPQPTEDHAIVGRSFDAIIGKQVAKNKYRFDNFGCALLIAHLADPS